MRFKKYALFAAALAVCLGAASPAAFAQAATQPSEPFTATSPPPRMDDYAQAGKIGDFIRDALAWAGANGASSRSPGVLLEALVVATADGNEAAVEVLRGALLWRYPRTIQGLYVIASFKSPAELREVLMNLLSNTNPSPSVGDGKQLGLVVRVVQRRLGEAFLNDEKFFFRVLALADLAGDEEIKKSMLTAAVKMDALSPRVKGLIDEAYRGEDALPDRIVKLHAHQGDEEAAFAVRAMLHKANPEQAQLTKIVRVRAERLLEDGQLEAALPHAQTLAVSKELDEAERARWTVLLAWAQLATGKESDAIAGLDALKKDHPKSPWIAPAEALRSAAGAGKAMDQLRDAIIGASQRLRFDCDQGELRAEIKADDAKKRTIYANWERGKSFELQVLTDGKPTLFLKSTSDGADLYTADANKIYRIKKALVPSPVLIIQRTRTGQYKNRVSFNLLPNVDGWVDALRNSLGVPEFSQSDAAGAMLASLQRGGKVATLTTDDKGVRKFALLSLRVREPEVDRVEFTFDAKGDWHAVGGRMVQLTSLAHGPAGSFKLAPPQWPEAPVEEIADDNPRGVMDLMKAFISVVSQLSEKKQ